MKLLMAYYADDFTGSTDALEFLTRSGARTVLFIEPPTIELLEQFGDLDAIGVAGMTRSMIPAKMEETLVSAFETIRALGPDHVHYKVCSTFDSSPEIGSIGCAIEVGSRVFENRITPVVVGAPALGRFLVFGNLFAKMGTGGDSKAYRLDRHPSVSRHPVTPMKEADLCRHLSKQTSKKIGLVDLLDLEGPESGLSEAVSRRMREDAEIVIFDTLHNDHLAKIGRFLDRESEKRTVFSVGSSGVDVALGQEWQRKGSLKESPDFSLVEPVRSLLVISGSCSPVTGGQIEWALSNGFRDVALDTSLFVSVAGRKNEIERVVSEACAGLKSGEHVIVHSARGPDDERLKSTQEAFAAAGIDNEDLKEKSGELFGSALGEVAIQCVASTGISRVIIAGGDSSSYAARAMGIEAVEMIAPLTPGAPLCRAFGPNSAIHGVEVNLKGGQIGGIDYFGKVATGRI